MQVTLGANDITAQTGGVQLNFVSKRAGNETSGDFHLYVEDKNWEMKQDLTPEMIARNLVVPGVNRLYQYGINLGGAIIKDKVWWFGSWAIQDIHKRTETNIEDATWLVSGSGKINFQFGNTTGDFHMSMDAKKKWGRTTLSPSQQDNGSLWDQDGPGYFYYGGISHVFGELMLNAKVVYSDGGFILDPRGADRNPANGHNEGADAINLNGYSKITGAYLEYSTNRNSIDASIDGNYFLENVLGGDHEIKFGVDYYTATTTSQSLYPNQRMAYVYTDGSPNYLRINPDYIVDVNFKRISAYVQDTMTFGKLTASIGLRYDKETGKVNPFKSPYFTWYEPGTPYHNVRMFEDQISELNIKGLDVPAAWELISPRVSLTYDITGNGKNVVKLSVGRYMSQSGNNMATRYIQYRYGYADWTDSNHDNLPQYNEVGILYNDDRFAKYNPSTSMVNVGFDENYNTPYLDELTLIFEKSLGEDIAASVTGFYKKKTNMNNIPNTRGELINVSKGIMNDGSLEKKSNWVNTGTFVVGGTTVPVWDQQEVPLGEYFYNMENSYQEYLGLQFRFTKKLSNNWLGDVSFTISDWKLHLDKNDLLNLNNFDFFDGGQVAPATTGSGLRDIWMNSNWMFKLNGMYQLPWGFNLSGFLQVKQGGPQPLRRNYSANQGTQRMYRAGYKLGDERLPTFWMLNLGLEKTLKVSDKVNATIVIDWYNATNNQIVLKHNLGIGADTPTGDPVPLMWSGAGLFQFGVRVNF